MRNHWANSITNFDNEVETFVEGYFGDKKKKCLLVAAAGFDPRSIRIASILADVMGDRLSAKFIREERASPDHDLVEKAEKNATKLSEIIPKSSFLDVNIFADDGAPVGGSQIVSLLGDDPFDADITDVILDLSALSIGVGFPAAKLLLLECEKKTDCSFHLMIVSNPELDDNISAVPYDRPTLVKGFSGPAIGYSTSDPACMWIPQLARGRKLSLSKIRLSIGECYKTCPILPFPARNPRRSDDLLSEYESELVNDWEVDPRDIVYVSEKNPLDSYRVLSTLKKRFDKTVKGTYEPHMILSPTGSKVMAAGALMVAIEHDVTVQYIETEEYHFNQAESSGNQQSDMIVHVLLSGPAYADYATSVKPKKT